MPAILLTSERLQLREMTLDDVDNLMQIFSDPIAMQYYPRQLNHKEAIAWIYHMQESYAKHSFGLWICELKATGEFIGQCGLVMQDNINGHDEVELGYLFVRKFWNQGFATEAAKICLTYAHEILNLHKIISLIRPVNHASIQVAIKNGFSAGKTISFHGQPHIIYSHHNKNRTKNVTIAARRTTACARNVEADEYLPKKTKMSTL